MPTQETQSNDLFPHDRRETFEYAIPEDVPEFHGTGQLNRVRAVINNAQAKDKLPRFWFTGPTGCGKTTAVRRLAYELEAPLFTVQGLYDIRRTDLLGSPTLLDGSVYWQDGPVTRALRASQDQQVVLLFDEVNRARPEAKGVLFPILDGRGRVHTGRGNEIIEGDPYNLIVVVTTNEGPEYFVEQLDLAEQRRYGSKFEMTYLGQSDFEAAVELFTNRTDIPEPLVRVVLTAVNQVRETAAETGSPVDKGIPTALVLEWLKSASIYDTEEIDEPMVAGFRDAILNPFYEDPDAVTTVISVIRSYVQGAPLTDEAVTEWVESTVSVRLDDEKHSALVENVVSGGAIDRKEL